MCPQLFWQEFTKYLERAVKTFHLLFFICYLTLQTFFAPNFSKGLVRNKDILTEMFSSLLCLQSTVVSHRPPIWENLTFPISLHQIYAEICTEYFRFFTLTLLYNKNTISENAVCRPPNGETIYF